MNFAGAGGGKCGFQVRLMHLTLIVQSISESFLIGSAKVCRRFSVWWWCQCQFHPGQELNIREFPSIPFLIGEFQETALAQWLLRRDFHSKFTTSALLQCTRLSVLVDCREHSLTVKIFPCPSFSLALEFARLTGAISIHKIVIIILYFYNWTRFIKCVTRMKKSRSSVDVCVNFSLCNFTLHCARNKEQNNFRFSLFHCFSMKSDNFWL